MNGTNKQNRKLVPWHLTAATLLIEWILLTIVLMRISVVIPTLNGGCDIERLVASLQAQKPLPPDEIIAVDSGSTDQTCNVVRQAGGKIVEWRKPFNHGLSRDAGISAASGEIVVLTVQDAKPAADDWLAHLIRHFDDPAVAGVSSRQIPPDDGPLELKIKAGLEAKESVDPIRISLAAHPDYPSYSPEQRLELYRFDNVCAALRRTVWEKIPFGECRYAEDIQWARRALEAGHTLIRDPSAPVIHAHRRSFGYEFRRALLDAWVLDETFSFRYRFLRKLNRATSLAGSGGSNGAKFGALKTYSAHALARSTYWGYCTLMRPLGLGRNTLSAWTAGI